MKTLMTPATSRNILPGGGGHAIVCSPEEILLEARRPGVFTATVDLARVQWLREQVDRPVDPWPWRTKPGIFTQCSVPRCVGGVGHERRAPGTPGAARFPHRPGGGRA